MFLQVKDTNDLVKIVDFQELIDPNRDSVHAQDQEGQEEQETEIFKKEELVFPSGEKLPLCWLDANYRKASYKKAS
ncbi:acetyltransferase [Nostoc sp. RF31YmG]|nr:acetyltransferase [Nostoc sp. RF31YmG]